MAERKIDYFGTFLDSGRPAKDLIPLVGNSVSRFISLSEQLEKTGLVKMDGDVFVLTEEGREIAAVRD